MAIQAGMGNLLRAIAPEESLSPESWRKLAEAFSEVSQDKVS
jgi:hypothetical protein